jgi:GTP cyclohydrolase II
MSLRLTPDEQIARMRADLRMGVPVVICNGDERWLAASAETLSADRLTDFRELGCTLELALTDLRAGSLDIAANGGNIARLRIPRDVPLGWIKSLSDPMDDLENPVSGPFDEIEGGCGDVHRSAIALAKQARLLPSVVVLQVTRDLDGVTQGLHCSDISKLRTALDDSSPLSVVSSARVPLRVSHDAQVHVFRPEDGGDEHYAIEVGHPDRSKPVLSRLHSACFTGDLIGSLKCDCGPQLQGALDQIGAEGAGVLLYMNQEGRGIGLANKMRAYRLQDQGFDTVEANHRLGFEDDERNFRLGAEILKSMGFNSVRLMTNNPKKVERMNAAGVEVVERVPLKVGENPINADYLATKAKKSGHLL